MTARVIEIAAQVKTVLDGASLTGSPAITQQNGLVQLDREDDLGPSATTLVIVNPSAHRREYVTRKPTGAAPTSERMYDVDIYVLASAAAEADPDAATALQLCDDIYAAVEANDYTGGAVLSALAHGEEDLFSRDSFDVYRQFETVITATFKEVG